jgi:hypothetical protein
MSITETLDSPEFMTVAKGCVPAAFAIPGRSESAADSVRKSSLGRFSSRGPRPECADREFNKIASLSDEAV